MVGQIIGSYQIIRKLGEGGMGTVYLAHHALLGRRAAIKLLRATLSARGDIVNRFFNEARATTSISDPGIVQIFDFGYHVDGSAYIVMEYLEGEPLDVRLAKLGRLTVVDALRLTRQVASSLAAAHAQSIVHRDLKPENIYLVRDPEVASGERPKILDFGIAKLSDDHPGKVKTHAGALMGTPMYMSPEQCRGASELDHRSDVYALGCVLFQLIVGAPPFDGEGMGDIIAAHLREPAPVPSSRSPGIAPAVDALILRCLEKRPADRFGSMAELVVAIGRVLPHPTASGAADAADAAAHVPPYLVGATPTPSAPPVSAPPVSAPPVSASPVSASPVSAPPVSLVSPVTPPVTPVATPTTLGSSLGQVTAPMRPGSRWLLPLLAIAVGAGGALAAVVVLRGGTDAGRQAEPGGSAAPKPVTEPAHGLERATTPTPDAPSPDSQPIDAAVDAAAPDGPPDAPDAAPVPVPVKRHRPRNITRPIGPGSSSDCNRAVDVDCDGIPDVR